MNEAQLIHMNGRVYDYNLGRFLSVDPLIHMEGGSQGINPYSYLMNNPLAGIDPTGYDPEKETIEVSADSQVYSDSDGNKYVSAGDGSGDYIKVDSISSTKSNGTTVTANFDNGSVTSMSATKGNATVSVTDIGSQQQTATLSFQDQGGGSGTNGEQSFIDDAFGATKEMFGDVADGIAWRYNAVADGISEDFSEGFLEGVINFTGGRTDTSALEDFRRNYAETSIVLGPIADLDKKATGMLVGGQLAKTNGGMTFGQWAKTGFRPAPHLQTRAATLGYVGRTSAINGAVVTAAYEFGNAVGSGIRVGVNRFARYLADE
ncbi:RHS repeat-associated core domain-containing protein [Pseudidiomarina donghaiensis]|uniref:RHS repeat-associated core domain-containing protein n=1 Tax=Pseudidiomarina donghaiensis TaxID=519452 RepID=UPI00210A9D63|nr:RHS repeat-associated core domain-containing protein [Pseudidiomarina donghaiensis]